MVVNDVLWSSSEMQKRIMDIVSSISPFNKKRFFFLGWAQQPNDRARAGKWCRNRSIKINYILSVTICKLTHTSKTKHGLKWSQPSQQQSTELSRHVDPVALSGILPSQPQTDPSKVLTVINHTSRDSFRNRETLHWRPAKINTGWARAGAKIARSDLTQQAAD